MNVKYLIGGAVAVFLIARYLAGRTKNNSVPVRGITVGETHPTIDDSRLIM